MCANPTIAQKICEKDRPILGYLQNIALEQHSNGFGFDLTFLFDKNSYFKEESLKKTFVMCKQNVIEKCIGSTIQWSPGCDPTKTKKKKGKGKKKTTVLVKAESFFNFFETVDTEKSEKPKNEKADEKADDDSAEDDEDRDPQAEQMEQDFDLGSTIRDELVPNALEYYLGIVQ